MKNSNAPNEVKAHHLARAAIVYCRQSSARQVEVNTGSTSYQRSQTDLACGWGWPKDMVVLVDQDLGLSGTSSLHRRGYLDMLERVRRDEVGAIFISDVSRGGRNALELFELIDLCKVHETLIVIDGVPHDMQNSAEALTTRILSTIVEHENSARWEAAERGRMAKIPEGKAVSPPPAGYVWGPNGTWRKDDDPAVRAAITAVFRAFRQGRSLRGALDLLKEWGVKLPRRTRWGVRWSEPQIGTIQALVHNPSYRGEYQYRRRVSDKKRGRDSRGKFRLRWNDPDKVLSIPNHHDPYVSDEESEAIQEILRLNGANTRRRSAGKSDARLQSLIRCRQHRNRLMTPVTKGERQDGTTAYSFYCQGDYWSGGPQCGRIAAKPIEDAVTAAVAARFSPPSLAALREEVGRTLGDHDSERHRLATDLRRVQQEADDLELRFMHVDPANRLVAKGIEDRLEAARRSEARLQRALRSATEDRPRIPDRLFEDLSELAVDLTALIEAPTTTPLERKQIMRLVIDEVGVVERDREKVVLEITWADGGPPEYVEARLNGFAQARLRELIAEGLAPEAIADRMNEMGLVTLRGLPWTVNAVLMAMRRLSKVQQNERA